MKKITNKDYAAMDALLEQITKLKTEIGKSNQSLAKKFNQLLDEEVLESGLSYHESIGQLSRLQEEITELAEPIHERMSSHFEQRSGKWQCSSIGENYSDWVFKYEEFQSSFSQSELVEAYQFEFQFHDIDDSAWRVEADFPFIILPKLPPISPE